MPKKFILPVDIAMNFMVERLEEYMIAERMLTPGEPTGPQVEALADRVARRILDAHKKGEATY